jgi:hypothetical protein
MAHHYAETVQLLEDVAQQAATTINLMESEAEETTLSAPRSRVRSTQRSALSRPCSMNSAGRTANLPSRNRGQRRGSFLP